MKIIQAFKNWRAARSLTKRTAKQELQAFLEYAATERHEYANAISVPHASVKAALNADAIATVSDNPFPMEIITEATPIAPPDLRLAYTHTTYYPTIDGASGASKTTSTAHLAFFSTPRVGGFRQFVTNDPHSAVLAFCYYEQRATHISLEQFPRRIRHALRLTPSSNPQFAAIIYDGLVDTPTTESTSFAGFRKTETRHERRAAQPTRVLLLGQLDAPAETMAIRRIIIDGKQMELTRDNLTLALAYAQQLTGQIFAGEEYDPAKAMRQARSPQASSIRTRRPSQG